MNVVALAGGVGGARLADGLQGCLPPAGLTVIVNTGDDFTHLGLKICPDLDTVVYTLAGRANPETGWGRAAETWGALQTLEELGGETWFRLGDHDLGLHLARTASLAQGEALSGFTGRLRRAWGVAAQVLPASDDPTPTIVLTGDGPLAFQEYFVRLRCEPPVTGFRFQGVEAARPAPGVLEALQAADLVVICPSNPWVSIAPILAVPGIEAAVRRRPVVAVSPIIGGQAVKGPAAKMFQELGIQPSALAVARQYAGLLSGFVLDTVDAAQAPAVQALGMACLATDSLMRSPADRRRLAREVLEFGAALAGSVLTKS